MNELLFEFFPLNFIVFLSENSWLDAGHSKKFLWKFQIVIIFFIMLNLLIRFHLVEKKVQEFSPMLFVKERLCK